MDILEDRDEEEMNEEEVRFLQFYRMLLRFH